MGVLAYLSYSVPKDKEGESLSDGKRERERETKRENLKVDSRILMVVTFLFYSIHIFIYMFFPTGLYFFETMLSKEKQGFYNRQNLTGNCLKHLNRPIQNVTLICVYVFFFFSPVVVILSLHVFCISLQDIIHM